MSRTATVTRATKETNVAVTLNLDGDGTRSRIETPIGFLSHMLEVIARHGKVDLDVVATGDVHIDYHHTVEDTALVLGEAFAKALGDKSGIRRFGHAYVPLDEALARVVVDFAGRPFLVFEVPIDREMLLIHKDFPFALVEEFFKSFANKCACNVHVDLIRGRNGHHAAESIFKAFAIALREAKTVIGTITAPDTGEVTITLNAAGIALVQSWVDDPSTNNGILIADSKVSDGLVFDSRNAETASTRPKLTVTYDAP